MTKQEEPEGPGAAPNIPPLANSVSLTIRGMHVYGKAMLTWLFASMEHEESKNPRSTGSLAVQDKLDRLESFREGGYFSEMEQHTKGIVESKNTPAKDMEAYKEMHKLFSLLMEFNH